MRKVYVSVKVGLIINADEDIEIAKVLNEMNYSFQDTTTKADIIDTAIVDWEITDSK